jgi:hypothetical protein
VTAGWLAVTLYMASVLHDLPHTISRHLFVLLYVPVVIAAALSEDIYQVEHLLKNVQNICGFRSLSRSWFPFIGDVLM